MHNQCPCLRGIMPNNSSIQCDHKFAIEEHQSFDNNNYHHQHRHRHHKNNHQHHHHHHYHRNESRDYCSVVVEVVEQKPPAPCECRVPHPDQHPFSPSAATNNDRNRIDSQGTTKSPCCCFCCSSTEYLCCCCHYHLQPNQINCNASSDNCCQRSSKSCCCMNSISDSGISSSSNWCPSFGYGRTMKQKQEEQQQQRNSSSRSRILRQRGRMAILTSMASHVTTTVSKLSSSGSSSSASWTLKSTISSIILLIALLPSFTLAGGESIIFIENICFFFFCIFCSS